MEYDEHSIPSVRAMLKEATRNLSFKQMKALKQPLCGSDAQSPKMKQARALSLRLIQLEQEAAAKGVLYPSDGMFHHPV